MLYIHRFRERDVDVYDLFAAEHDRPVPLLVAVYGAEDFAHPFRGENLPKDPSKVGHSLPHMKGGRALSRLNLDLLDAHPAEPFLLEGFEERRRHILLLESQGMRTSQHGCSADQRAQDIADF